MEIDVLWSSGGLMDIHWMSISMWMSVDQVRWKINALTKKYKECVDNNSKSGRNPMTFEWFDQMDEIFGKQKNATAIHTMLSGFPHIMSNSSTSLAQKFDSTLTSSALKSSTSKSSTTITVSNDPAVLLENCSNKNVQISTSVSSKTGTRKRKLHGSGSNIARAKIALENQWLEYLNMKAELKLREKENRHAQQIEIEKEKCKLLKVS
nr:PREDICTED: uncharacterized protein LOC105672855 [Linepithema humile]